MPFTKIQYFLSYAVMGSVLPFLAIFLKEQQGLNESQIGYIVGVASCAILVTPVLMTLLADTRLDPRRLAAGMFLFSGLFLLLLDVVDGFWPTLLLFALHNLAFVAILPLQDGIMFSLQRRRQKGGMPTVPYHRVRVWGTIGFIIPSILLYVLLHSGKPIGVIMLTGVFFCVLGLCNTWFVPDPRVGREDPGVGAQDRLPTAAAARALLRGNVLVFCIGIALAHLAAAGFYGFYALYLTEEVGLEQKWVGLIFNVGVTIEIFFVLGMGWLIRTFGLRRLMLIGVVCMALRTALLALFPTVTVAILSQTLHGIIIVALFIAPIVYINRQAGDRYRNSIQGLYTMSVVGASRILGSILSGYVALSSLRLLFALATVLCLVSGLLFLLLFRADRSDRSVY